MMSKAQLSDATQYLSPIMPSASGRRPAGSRKAITRSFVITTVEKAPSSRGITSARASSTRSASWVESSAAMISESEVPRKLHAPVDELRVELDGVDQVAVVGERHLAAVGAPDRLGVLPRRGAGGRVAHVPHRQVAAERAQLLLVEHLRDEAEVAHGHDLAGLARGDARGLLAAVLKRVQREVREAGDVGLRRVDAEDAALVARSVAMVELGIHALGAGPRRCPTGEDPATS